MRIAPFTPTLCTGCGLAKPHDTFVDFEVNYDGPTFELEGAKGFIHELALCESCVGSAADVLDLKRHAEPLRLLQQDRDHLRALAEGWREYALSLEETYGRRPEPIRRGPGRPPRTAPRPGAEPVAP